MRPPISALAFALATAVILPASGASAAPSVASTIAGVTVHPSGAVVTRTASVELAAGTSSFTILELPADAPSESFQVRLANGADAEVLGLTVETIIRKPERNESFRATEREVFALRDQLAAIDRRADDARASRETLRNLAVDEPVIRKPESVKLEPASWSAAFARIRDGLVDAARAGTAADHERRHVLDKLRDAETRLVEAGAIRTASHKQATLDLHAPHAGSATLELAYFVPGASWKPAYTVRVDDAGAVTLARRARVVQRTGEDWRGVPLSFSTTDPRFQAGPAELRSWRIRELPPPELPKKAFAQRIDASEQPSDFEPTQVTGFFQPPSRYVGEPISLDVSDAPIRDVVSEIASRGGLNLVMGDDVQGRVTLKLTGVPWDQALDHVLALRGLGKEREGNTVRVASRAALDREQEARIRNQDRSSKLEPVILKIIAVQYAIARELMPQLRQVASRREDASIDVDDRTNTLILKDTDRVVEVMTDLIHSLDVRIYPDEPPFWMVHDLAPAVLDGAPETRSEGWRKRFDDALSGRETGAPAPGPLFPPESAALAPTSGDGDRRVPRFVFGPTVAVTVPSDARAHELLLGTAALTAELGYEVAPLARPDALLAARLTPGDEPFVAGSAESFIAGEYAGRTTLPDAVSGETVRVALGPDPRMVVRRVERKRQEDTGLTSAKVTETTEVRIEIENHGGAAAAVRLADRRPFTLDERLTIGLNDVTPALREDLTTDRERGLLGWDLAVPAGETATARYTLTIERPRDGVMTFTTEPVRGSAP